MTLERIDHAVRRLGAPIILFVFLIGLAAAWWNSGAHAQSLAENSIRLGDLEFRYHDQAEAIKAATTELADHDRRMAVLETTAKELQRRLDDIEGYEKWLVFGVLSLVGLRIWEQLLPPGKRARLTAREFMQEQKRAASE